MVVRDVKQAHPETVAIFEEFGFRTSCDDCDIEVVSRKQGVASQDVLEALNKAVFASSAPKED
jgi:hypothetical protein